MDCTEVREALRRGAPPEGPAATAHLAECEVCRALVASDGKVGRALAGAAPAASVPPSELEAIFARVQADVARERGWRGGLRSLRTGVRVTLVVATAAVVAFAVLLISGRDPTGGGVVGSVIARILYAGLAFGAVATALRPLGKSPQSGALAPAAVAAAVVLPLAIAFLPSPSLEANGGLPHAATCFAIGLSLGLPTLIVARLVDRGGASRSLALVLLAVGSGLAGVLALETMCLVRAPVHLLLGHATVVLGYIAAAAVARSLLRR